MALFDIMVISNAIINVCPMSIYLSHWWTNGWFSSYFSCWKPL